MRTSAPLPNSMTVVFRSLFLCLCLIASALALSCTGSSAETDALTSDERVERLHAFAKLYGYVRYFHPSDAAAAVDWERFAVHGARVVAESDPERLGDILSGLFAPIAPTVQIFAEGEAPAPPDALSPEDPSGLELVAWQHLGVGLGNPGPYRSARLNRSNRRHVEKETPQFGTITQVIDAEPYRGFEVRLAASVRAEVSDAGSQAQVWIRVDREGRQMGFFDNMQDRAVTTSDWQRAELVGTVADDAVRIALGGFLVGSGTAFFDDFQLSVRPRGGDGDATWQPVELANADFEAGQDDDAARPEGWGGGGEGYAMSTFAGNAAAGDQALRIEWRGSGQADQADQEAEASTPLFEARPEPGEVVEKALGSGLVARVPIALFSRDGATLRPEGAPSAEELTKALASIDLDSLSADDEALRVADVIMAWNVFQHFYPYFDVVDVDWDGVLGESLRRALLDETADEFLRTLRWMVAQLGDGHGWVSHTGELQFAGLPLRLGWIEGRAVVTAVDASSGVAGAECPRLGDVVTSIDGRAMDELVDDWRSIFSGSPQLKATRAVRMAPVGPVDRVARLEIERAGETETSSFAPDVTVCEVARADGTRATEARPEPVAVLDGGVFYVDLGRAPMPDIAARMNEIAAAPGVVFDLRGYPQGNHDVLRHLTDEPLRSAHWQVPQQIYPDQDRLVGHDTPGRWLLEPAEPRVQGEVVFLTDGRAISYAESVMGIVEHYRLGEIVGSTTAGANGNVNPFTLPGGYRVAWTGMRVVKHDGSQHHLVGIQPTVPVKPTLVGVRTGRDEVLERGLALVAVRQRGRL